MRYVVLQRFTAVLSAAFLLSACGAGDRNQNARTSSAKPDATKPAPWELASANAGASSGASVPTAPAPTGGSPVVPLPDFTPLMKIDGPAVVNVITTNKARSGRRGSAQSPG